MFFASGVVYQFIILAIKCRKCEVAGVDSMCFSFIDAYHKTLFARDNSRSSDKRMNLPDGWSLKKSRLGQKAFIHAETNTKIFEVPDENTIFELAKARPKKYSAFLDRIAAEKTSEIAVEVEDPVETDKPEELLTKQVENKICEDQQPPVSSGNGEFFLAFIKKT